MKMEPPYKGRTKIYDDGQLFQVRAPARRNPLVIAFLSFWLCGWLFGEVTVLRQILSGSAGSANLFLLFWLGGWTIGGLTALTHVLWLSIGYELLSIQDRVLKVQRIVPIFRRGWAFDIQAVKDLRVQPDANAEGVGRNGRIESLFGPRNNGVIKFDYGMKTIGFGQGIDEAEARIVLEKVQHRLAHI